MDRVLSSYPLYLPPLGGQTPEAQSWPRRCLDGWFMGTLEFLTSHRLCHQFFEPTDTNILQLFFLASAVAGESSSLLL